MNDFINKMGEYWSQLSFDKLGDILTYHHNAPILFSTFWKGGQREYGE